MNLAFNQAKRGLGKSGDNPSVGCVIVKNNEIIGSGYTGFNGRPHAEEIAINSAKDKCNMSTMFVTMEPCSHYGKTPPCTRLLINSKVKKVIYSIEDQDISIKTTFDYSLVVTSGTSVSQNMTGTEGESNR